MKNENCAWYFDVKGCTPSIQCHRFNVKGWDRKNMNRNINGFTFRCKGDKLIVVTDNGRNIFCGKNNKLKSFTEEQSRNKIIIQFVDYFICSNNIL